MKKNIRLIVVLLVGFLIGGSLVVVIADTLFANQVSYDNTNTTGLSSNVQDALDELYDMAQNAGDAGIDDNSIDFSTIQTSTLKTVLASSKGVCINRNNKLNCFKRKNFAEEQNHIQQVFSDISCDVGSSDVCCTTSDFDCCVGSSGYVDCFNLADNSYCVVDWDGSVTCGRD